jgi:transcriptional regulator with XRE-family HTH domain
MAPIKRMAMKLKKIRQERQLTQEQLAERAGVTREYIARLEAGRYDPSLSTIEKLAKALRVKVNDLVG